MADPVMLGGLGQALIDVVDPLRRALVLARRVRGADAPPGMEAAAARATTSPS